VGRNKEEGKEFLLGLPIRAVTGYFRAPYENMTYSHMHLMTEPN
jgi:hypothetical protein